jgi:hypothetical protein
MLGNPKEHTMKTEDSDRAARWYLDHKKHVDRLIAAETNAYEPSDATYHMGGDAHDPALWKPAHWRWFIQEARVRAVSP